MNRRHFLKAATAVPLLTGCSEMLRPSVTRPAETVRRVRPGDAAWPAEASWDGLRQAVGGRLIRVESPLTACRMAAKVVSCDELFENLRNPFYIDHQPALTQTAGWADAWTSASSIYAVAAERTADVVAAVNFARENNVRLVVKGGGHSYQGTSNAADSLLIWTRRMNGVVLHDAFVALGCDGTIAPQPAVTVEAGANWMRVYHAATTRAGRYVQGGGCTTVGVAGLIQSGGFGSFSKNYGLAAAGLLQVEVVTADGAVLTTNACRHPDLFWALKGGGGGTFGVVTRLTLKTRELPDYFGGVFGTIRAHSDTSFRSLIARIVSFYRKQLFNRHWGEQIRFQPGNIVNIAMVFQGLSPRQAEDAWRPLLDWLAEAPQDFSWEEPLQVAAVPARHFWDAAFLEQNAPGFIIVDDRPDAPEGSFIWAGDRGDAGQFLHAYRSAWLPASLLEGDRQSDLEDALFQASRQWGVSLHFNKGLAGAPANELAAARATAINPVALEAFALAIVAGNSAPAFPGIPGHEPNLVAAREDASAVNRSMDALLKIVAEPGAYVSESDFFERGWQQSFWGGNYPRLAAVKERYDPGGLFFVHHGVGSEEWSADGFTRTGRTTAAIPSAPRQTGAPARQSRRSWQCRYFRLSP